MYFLYCFSGFFLNDFGFHVFLLLSFNHLMSLIAFCFSQAINFQLNAALVLSHNFDILYFHFYWIQILFLFSFMNSSLNHSLYTTKLFSLQMYGNFSEIFFYISNLIPLWTENIFSMNWILWTVLRLLLCVRIYSLLTNVLRVLEKIFILMLLCKVFINFN